MKKNLLLMSLFLFLSINFDIQALKGSGKVISEERQLPLFQSIELRCMGHVIITEGKTGKINITCDDNIMPLLKTIVDKSVLIISLTKVVTVAEKLEIIIPMETVTEISVVGSGKVDIQKKLIQDSIKFFLSGSGNITSEIDTKFAIISISGNGSIDLYGKASKLETDIAGASLLNALDFITDEAIISLTGSALAKVTVNNRLEANLKGGTIQYKGSPKIYLKATFAGNLEAL